jgi:hypothetical protein
MTESGTRGSGTGRLEVSIEFDDEKRSAPSILVQVREAFSDDDHVTVTPTDVGDSDE